MNGHDISRWIAMTEYPLRAYAVDGICVFPVYATSGSITTTTMAFIARHITDFPENGDLGIGNGLSDDGKFARIEFDGRKRYAKAEIDAILSDINRSLL